MSLLGQTARYLLLSALIVALLGAVVFYALIYRTIRHEVDEILFNQFGQTEKRLHQQPPATPLFMGWDDNPRVERITGSASSQPVFSDVFLRDSLNSEEQIRQLQATVSVGAQTYLVTIRQPYYEFNELTRIMAGGVIFGFLGLMALSVVIGLALAQRLWKPFYGIIGKFSSFRLDQPTDLAFPTSRVREFKLLGQSLGELTHKLRLQYQLQKQFTENASHELQTPLAIALAELELLMQSDRLSETDWEHLQHATHALSRLSQLNRSLLLLTQVENNQFAGADDLNLSSLLNQYADEYEPFFQHKHIRLEQSISPDVHLRINRQLAGILLTNLLKNAARHGKPKGCAGLSLTSDELIIYNTGEPLPFADSQLFNRFVKHPGNPDSTGLGLALVKQIADQYQLPLAYRYDTNERIHSFRLGLRSTVQS
ncbi:sensor histidine kinase [Spirosoma fluminis]